MTKVVIIGAGLTGLSTAYHLEKRGFFDYQLFEKDGTVGGLCRSVELDGFTFDYTGHLLHTSDDYFKTFIKDIVGFEHLNTITRRSFVFSHNTFTRYPFQINLHGLPHDIIIDCIEGYVTRKKSTKKAKNFPEWVLQNYGRGMAQHFFFPFQKKIFASDLRTISPSWVGRFVPSTSLRQIINGALKDTFDPSIGYNAHFFYPKKGGIEFWIRKVAENIQNPIKLEHEVMYIDAQERKIIFKNGDIQNYDVLINTMPLDIFLQRLRTPSNIHFKSALNNLLCNSVVNFNYGIAQENLTQKHWIYVPEKKYPFYRLGFPHNFARNMAPEGASSLYGEFSHLYGSNRLVNAQLAASKKRVLEMFNLQETDIITQKIMHISHAYVLYTHWRERYLPKILTQLAALNIHSIGRYGAWKYSSMQEAILDGKKAAELVTILPAQKEIHQYSTPITKVPTYKELQ